MEGVEERLRLLFVAAAALIHHREPEIAQPGPGDGVRRVTVLAVR